MPSTQVKPKAPAKTAKPSAAPRKKADSPNTGATRTAKGKMKIVIDDHAAEALGVALAAFAQSLARRRPGKVIEFTLRMIPPALKPGRPRGPGAAPPIGKGGPSLFHSGEPVGGGPPGNDDGTSNKSTS